MPRVALLGLVLLASLAPAQQIVGTYRQNDLAGLRQAVQGDPDNAGLRLRLAQALLRTGRETAHPDAAFARLKEAEAEFSRILQLYPDARVPLRIRAFDAYKTRRFSDTISNGQRLLALFPGDTDVCRFVLKSLVREKRKDDAVRFFVDWLERGTTPSLGALQGSIYSLTLDQEFRQKFAEALDAAIAKKPRDVQLLLYKSILLSETGRNEAAWKVLHEAERLGLCDARTGQRHAFARTLAGKTTEHGANPVRYMGSDLPEIDAALKRAPDHVGLRMRRARVLDIGGEKPASITGYGAALEKNPDLWPALIRRGELLIEAGRAKEAISLLQRARGLYPELAAGRLLEIEARMKVGPDAETAARIVAEARRAEPVSRVIDLLAEVGKNAAFAQTLDQALRAAMAKEPKSPYLPAHLALVAKARGQRDEARKLALLAERRGLAGPEAYPHRVIFWTFEEPLPKAMTQDNAGGR